MAEADLVQQLGSLLAGLVFGRAEQPAEQGRARQFQAKGDVVQHRQMREHRVALEHHAPARVRFAGKRLAVEKDFATARAFLSQQHAQEGGLAAAGGADQGAELAFLGFQIQAFEYGVFLVYLPDVLHLNESAHALPPSYQGNALRVSRRRP
ncbi:hypothetical protein D9M68_863850 [compost metagenome]